MHKGISCDACSMKPIRGPCHRKCLKEDTEDYCLDCYNELDDEKKRQLSRVEVKKLKAAGGEAAGGEAAGGDAAGGEAARGEAAGGNAAELYRAEQEVSSAVQEVTSIEQALSSWHLLYDSMGRKSGRQQPLDRLTRT